MWSPFTLTAPWLQRWSNKRWKFTELCRLSFCLYTSTNTRSVGLFLFNPLCCVLFIMSSREEHVKNTGNQTTLFWPLCVSNQRCEPLAVYLLKATRATWSDMRIDRHRLSKSVSALPLKRAVTGDQSLFPERRAAFLSSRRFISFTCVRVASSPAALQSTGHSPISWSIISLVRRCAAPARRHGDAVTLHLYLFSRKMMSGCWGWLPGCC